MKEDIDSQAGISEIMLSKPVNYLERFEISFCALSYLESLHKE